METPYIDPSHTAKTDLTPSAVIPPECINEPLNEAMFLLCRGCATDFNRLPPAVLEAYTDRDHSKFSLLLWQKYLDGLTDAIAKHLRVIKNTCPAVYRAYQGVLMVKTYQGKQVQL